MSTGLLQARFLAGAVGVNIRMICEDEIPEYTCLLPACSCKDDISVHFVYIMLIRTERSRLLNHFIPLFWKAGEFIHISYCIC